MSDERFDKRCAELYVKHMLSTYQVAERMGCSQGRVFDALKRQNVTMRSASDAAKLR